MKSFFRYLLTKKALWLELIILLIITITFLHYSTPTMKWQYHLIYMQAYFIPILLGAFQFGLKGGLTAAVSVTILYFPHIMLHWGGLVEENLMRFLQILLFNVIGYLTGLKAQREMDEKARYQKAAKELDKNYEELKIQSGKMADLDVQLRHSDRLAVIGELSASLAHEVRNPLGAIRGAVEIIRDELPENMKNFEFINILIEETKRLNEVVENYLGFAHKSKKKDFLYNVNDTISNSVLLMKSQAHNHNIKLDLNLPDNSIELAGDPNDIRQILTNLIINSIQSIDGAGKIGVNVYKTKQNDSDSNNENLIISITDTGKGINKIEIENIFKPFYTSKKEGTGLGLAIVKRIIEANGWSIQTSSKPEIGTQFTITIPLIN